MSQTGTDFASLPLLPALISVVKELGWEQLTPIQAQAIPVLVEHKDLIGQSQTGSGKTAAFALPLLNQLELAKRELTGLVVCPTRELSAQVARELRRLGKRMPGLSVVVLAGGDSLREQSKALEKGAHLAVGTPGRILDHLKRRTLKVHRVAMVVLDEADRMLEMGFLNDVAKLLKALPSARQTALFSATFPASIRELSTKYQRDPVRIAIEDESTARPKIEQIVLQVATPHKLSALQSVLQRHPHESALVFANQKATVAELEQSLATAGLSVAALHGNLEQFDRDRVLAKFRNGSTRVLVATDVAARGIDLQKLDLVVNFELPTQPVIYVHRIGRTGRAGQPGLAISLCAPAEQPRLAAIELYIGSRLTTGERPAAPPRPSAKLPAKREAKMDTIRLLGGRKQKLRPGDILGALTGAGALSGTDIGVIEIHDRFAYVAVAKSVSQRALQSLNEGRIKGKRFKAELMK
ncbi:MAG TPA: ATP-dependent RNA helicase DbpA [Polyangiaceae bacterium]|nr:ATP-dependent RNA helicase DbpA [Polyangiaceae bacterium]